MKIFNKLAIGAAALAGTATLGAGVMAATVTTGTNPMNHLANAIASKFNLNPTDVQKVFDEERTQMQAQRQAQGAARVQERLDQAVKDGKLTQAQKDMILAKHVEMQNFMKSLDGKTPVERQAAMKTEMDAVQAWAKTNNIPEEYVMMFGNGGRGLGQGMGKGMGMGKGKGMMGMGEGIKNVLSQAVTDGKLSQAQSDLIAAKHDEYKTFMQSLQGKTQEERQTAIDAKQLELEGWAKTNNISLEFVKFGPGERGQNGMHKGWGNQGQGRNKAQ